MAATERLAAALANVAVMGDVIALRGDLGAGKTAFARAFIRAAGDAQGLTIDEVPSPTFTIVQLYDELTPPIWHVDLYRLEHVNETIELGLEEGFETAISLIEWPDRLGNELPPQHLDLTLVQGATEEARVAQLGPHGAWASRLDVLRDFQ